MVRTRDLAKMGRRNFIETLSAIGVSTNALRFLTIEKLRNLTTDPEDQIPRLYSIHAKNSENYRESPVPDTPPEIISNYYTISRDEWVHVEGYHQGARNVKSILTGKINTRGIAIGVGKTTSNIRKKREVKVNYNIVKRRIGGEEQIVSSPIEDFKTIKEYTPETIDATVGRDDFEETVEDIPVEVVENNIVLDGCNKYDCAIGDYFEHRYADVPGGCHIEAQEYNYNKFGTLATPVWDYEWEAMGYVTAAHLFLDEEYDTDSSDADSRIAWQPEGTATSDRIGRFDRGAWHKLDDEYGRGWDVAVLRKPFIDRKHIMKLASDAGDDTYEETIQGQLSFETIRDMEANNESLCRQGQTTGRCSGEVKDVVDDGDKAYFSTGAYSYSGDSGGPHFDYDNDGNAVIAGIHYGSNDSSAFACPIDQSSNEFNFMVP